MSLLRGDARNTLNGLPVTSVNFAEAKEILQRRFGNQELIIFVHIQALLSLQVATKQEELAHFYEKLVANLRALSALNISSDNYGVILTPTFISRSTSEVHGEWSCGSEGHEGDLNYGFLEKEICRHERGAAVLS